ncbi:MAG: hypothetical protein GY820_40425, partial [Gammaproteobacteria bacterium]|nr:hypothetical protein [Gammaproteobacteria bacterium]
MARYGSAAWDGAGAALLNEWKSDSSTRSKAKREGGTQLSVLHRRRIQKMEAAWGRGQPSADGRVGG